MTANTVVRAPIDAKTRQRPSSPPPASDAFRMMPVRTVAERRLLFDPLVPNAETIEAMQAARKGDTKKVGTPEDLLADLHADD